MKVGSFGPGSSPSGSADVACGEVFGEVCTAFTALRMASFIQLWNRRLFLNTVLWIFGIVAMSNVPTAAAVEPVEVPPVRLRLELLSIRNRSASPVPVKVKLEYNDPKILQGDLELLMYDGRDVVSDDDLRATMRFPDITLSGTDYTFHALLPPVSTSTIQNLAVLAWFHLDGKRIPLSSSVKEIDPPVPHDLLMISPNERATLVCSCRASGYDRPSRPVVRFLEDALSLENYNPVQGKSRDTVDAYGGVESRTDRTNPENAGEQDSVGAHIQYYAAPWSAADLPVDPLAYCSFDLVLLADGGLGAASVEQMQALSTWVQGGGSVCIVPDTPLKASHLEFVRNLTLEMTDEGGGAESDAAAFFELNEQGRLLLDGAEVSRVVLSRAGLGRVAVLPAVDDLRSVLSAEGLGRLVGFLWKIRSDVPIHEGKKWAMPDLQAVAKEKGLTLNKDENGWYLDFSQMYSSQLGRNAWNRMRRQPLAGQNPANCYFDEDQLLELLIPDISYAPGTESILENSARALLPADVSAVPAWLIGLILAAYVVTIGPVDYFVLGFLRLRKATWVLFPVVTLLFTMLTIAVASSYLGSRDTGGAVTVTDVVRGGVPIRRTGITMSFLGARATVKSEHRSQLVVHACDAQTAYRPQMRRDGQRVSEQILNHGTPMHYQGRFPQSYQVSHSVQQWSPQLVRTLEFAPTDADVPKIDWQDTSLITTPEGRDALGIQLKQQIPKDVVCSAVVLRSGHEMVHVLAPPDGWEYFGTPKSSGVLQHSWLIRAAILETTWNSRKNGFFRLAATVSPQGSAVLEDLRMLDFSDSSQWALIIILQQNNTSRVFRKLYHVTQ